MSICETTVRSVMVIFWHFTISFKLLNSLFDFPSKYSWFKLLELIATLNCRLSSLATFTFSALNVKVVLLEAYNFEQSRWKFFCGNRERILIVNYFPKKATS